MDKSDKVNYVRNHHITRRLVDDKLYRGRVVLYKGMITSLLFAGFKMIVAIAYRSVWFGAVAVYYLALSGMRYLLVKYMRMADEVSAMYAFYTLTMSIINLIKYRKYNSPVISAAKVIGLASALMSILALQTAMLAQFGTEQLAFIKLMNSLTGGAVCLAIFAMAIIMIWKSREKRGQKNK